ncbi:MAG: hypothetical protein M1828_004032 [Chrysothrix sp. TS-e1954]|nr:MAG: hypothetical protein M1828_004032 [Chrysothrix sp. TS-e1954]
MAKLGVTDMAGLDPIDMHPWLAIPLQIALVTCVIAFTEPRSIIRPAVLLVEILCTWIVVTRAEQHVPDRFIRLSATHSVTFMLHYLIAAIWERWHVTEVGRLSMSEQRNSIKPKGPQVTRVELSSRLRAGFQGALGWRRLDTPKEVNNVPTFSQTDPQYTPTRAVFLAKASLLFTVCYLIMDITASSPLPANAAETFADTRVPFFARLSSVSIEELLTRVFASLAFWINLWANLQLGYTLVAIPSVILGSDVRSWRPVFGSLSEAYTLRLFWGTFWHQWFRAHIQEPAAIIAHNVLQLPKTGFIQRYAKIFLTFIVSGLMHMVIYSAVNQCISDAIGFRFFLMQPCGIVVEDAVQGIWRQLQSTGGGLNSRKAEQIPRWHRLVGYTWIVLFLTWTTPSWVYPVILQTIEVEHIPFLPFSVVGLI